MSSKVKPRQQKKPRTQAAFEAIARSGAGPHKFKWEKRQGNPKKAWSQGWDE